MSERENRGTQKCRGGKQVKRRVLTAVELSWVWQLQAEVPATGFERERERKSQSIWI